MRRPGKTWDDCPATDGICTCLASRCPLANETACARYSIDPSVVRALSWALAYLYSLWGAFVERGVRGIEAECLSRWEIAT